MSNEIIISPYNPDWPNQFDEETHKNKVALGVNCSAIHHIGSTSVQNLAAEPISNIIPVVKDLSLVNDANKKMQALGYDIKGEYGFLLRRFFIKEELFHVHVFEEKNTEIERHLNFCNWLRYHPVDRNAYENLKREVASKFKNDRQGYAFAKSDFVTNIDKLTGRDGIKVVKALSEEEWAYVAKHCTTKNSPLSHDEQNCYLTLLHYAEVVECAHVHMPKNGTPSIKKMFTEN